MSDHAVDYAKDLLKRMAAESGWKVVPDGDFQSLLDISRPRVLVTEHVGLGLTRRGHPHLGKLAVKTAISGAFRNDLAKGWRKLTGIEIEDRRSVLELIAKFPQIEAFVVEAEHQHAEASTRQKQDREALASRMERFRLRTGVKLYLKPYGPVEAIDEPLQARYVRPPGWIKRFALHPDHASFTIEVPDQGDKVENLYLLIRDLERRWFECDKKVDKNA